MVTSEVVILRFFPAVIINLSCSILGMNFRGGDIGLLFIAAVTIFVQVNPTEIDPKSPILINYNLYIFL